MDRPMPDSSFKFMSFLFRIRDLFIPREKVLKDVPIKPGQTILDYGCGPGAYVLPAAKLVGPAGKIYALDIHPLALQKVKERTAKKGITNVETILSDRKSNLPANSIDIVFLFDIFHGLSEAEDVLSEIHRVLKKTGVLCVNDHHLKDEDIISGITHGGSFTLKKQGNRVLIFNVL